MRHRVEPRGDGQGRGQRHREIDVIDDGFRQDRRIAPRRLLAAGGLAENVGHFGAGVGGRDDDLIRAGADGDRFAEPGGRAASERDDAVGASLAKDRKRGLGDVDRRVHRGAGENADAKRAQPLRERFRVRLLVRRRQDERARMAELLDLDGGLRDRAKPEDHARAQPRKDERLNRRSCRPRAGLSADRRRSGVRRRIIRPSVSVRRSRFDPSPRASAGALQTSADGALVVLRHDGPLGFVATIQEGRLESVLEVLEQTVVFRPGDHGSGRHDASIRRQPRSRCASVPPCAPFAARACGRPRSPSRAPWTGRRPPPPPRSR